MEWYERKPAEYKEDTWHLTLAEHGAYNHLIDHYYSNESPLPDNDQALASICNCTPDEWASVKGAVRDFFVGKNGKLRHKKCEQILKKAYKLRSDGAKRAANYRKKKKSVTRDKRVSNASTGQDRTGQDNKRDTNVSPVNNDIALAVGAYNNLAVELGLSKVQRTTKARERKLLARLRDAGGLDGWLVALEKVRGSGFLTGAKTDWKASFDFMLQESSFVKIMEGAYDDVPVKKNGGSQAQEIQDAFDSMAAELREREKCH